MDDVMNDRHGQGKKITTIIHNVVVYTVKQIQLFIC